MISHDTHSNTYNEKHTWVAEVIPICRDDLLVLPSYNRVPGLGELVLVIKITSQVTILDPVTGRIGELRLDKFWKRPFQPVASREVLT